jgi:hypothetical protein
MAAAAAGSHIPRACCFLATCAGDGKVLFWDVRVDKLVKKGTKRVDAEDLVWRPMHVVHLLSSQGESSVCVWGRGLYACGGLVTLRVFGCAVASTSCRTSPYIPALIELPITSTQTYHINPTESYQHVPSRHGLCGGAAVL